MASDEKVGDNSSVASKLIVITGASSGIGEACVIPFVEKGHPVLMLARNVGNMEKGKAEIVKKVGKECESRIFIKKCDVTATEPKKDDKDDKDGKRIEYHSISSAIAECISENSNDKCKLYCDCIINNAGIMLLESIETQAWDKMQLMITVNINGVLNGLRAVISEMKSRKQGTIINVSSMAGVNVMKTAPVYSGTKFAVHGFTEALRQEMADSNVRVCIICPGMVETNLLTDNNAMVQKYAKQYADSLKLGILLPQDIANGCFFIYNQHPRCCVRELHIAPVNQVSP